MSLWISVHNQQAKKLLIQVKEFEKKYNWITAANSYEVAVAIIQKEKDFLRIIELYERLGFCFYRAAFQAKTKGQFVKLIKQGVIAYEQAVKFLENVDGKEKLAKIYDSKAQIALLNAWIETDPSKWELLIIEWEKLKKKAIRQFEEVGNHISAGKAYNDFLHGSIDHRMFWLDSTEKAKEYLALSEKSIKILSKTQDNYELARAYTWASWYYSFSAWWGVHPERKEEFCQKSSIYTKKALTLTKKIGDAYLLYEAYQCAGDDALFCHGNAVLAIDFAEKGRELAIILKDNNLLARGNMWTSWISLVFREEDPEKHRKRMKKSAELALNAINNLKLIGTTLTIFPSYRNYIESLTELASLEVNFENKLTLLRKAVNTAREFLDNIKLQKNTLYWAHQIALISGLYQLSKTETKISEKRQILFEAQEYSKRLGAMLKKLLFSFHLWRARNLHFLALIQTELAKLELDKQNKIGFLKKAVVTMESCLEIVESEAKVQSWKRGLYGEFYHKFGEILSQLYTLTGEKKVLNRAIAVYSMAAKLFGKAKLLTHVAESYWQIAKLQSYIDEYEKAALGYDLASKNYKLATKKIPQLKGFYDDYSLYMQAWNQIEKAKQAHSMEDYVKAKEHYEKAAALHQSSEPWSYLAPNYFAWASIEDAEDLSRKEKSENAKQAFQKAQTQFIEAERSIKQIITEITTADEKDMALDLSDASKLRVKYCEARILLEDAKLLDRKGRYLQSSKSYAEAAKDIESIIEDIENEAERKELELISILCKAWQKMALAEDEASSDLYLEAAKFFENAKDLSSTNKTRLWALGNTSFCKGLAAQSKFQNTLQRSDYSLAIKHVNQASNYYKKAGYRTASEYSKATQRLFDAYLYMHNAEGEVDPEKKTKFYRVAEQLLQIAAGSFVRTKQPEKSAEVQRILVAVREEKALAISLTEVMKAPSIASSTLSFATPTPTGEVSVGLESFEHANVQANLITHVKQVKVGESFCLSVEFVNAGKEPALLTRVEDFVPADFVVVKKPEIYRLEDDCLNMKGKQIAPLKLVEVKLVIQPSRKGIYQLKPKVHYLDELGQKKILQLKSVEVKVQEVILANRVSTGTKELDSLLFGGIPKEYSVVLTGSPSDERELLIKNFLETGIKQDQTTFYVTTEACDLDNLLENSNFYLFLCNPKPKVQVLDLPNIVKLRSKTDINNLNMVLARTSRNTEQETSKRVCIDIVSDVLLRLGPEITRRWLSELITDLTSKGFTMLAVLNSGMHPADQANAITYLFDGKISLTQSDDPLECRKFIRVEKLRNQDYIKNPICITK
jgi:KaiC/GvpD/RAD55 family RecA-like ATPase